MLMSAFRLLSDTFMLFVWEARVFVCEARVLMEGHKHRTNVYIQQGARFLVHAGQTSLLAGGMPFCA